MSFFPVLNSNFISQRSKGVMKFNYVRDYPLTTRAEFEGGMHGFLRLCNLTSPSVPAVVYASVEQSSKYREPRYFMLMSYDTRIEVYDNDNGCFCRLWNSSSRTTERHERNFKSWLSSNLDFYNEIPLDGTQQLQVKSVDMWHWGEGWYGRNIGEFPQFTELFWNKLRGRGPLVWDITARDFDNAFVRKMNVWARYSIVKYAKDPWLLYEQPNDIVWDDFGRTNTCHVPAIIGHAGTFEEIYRALMDDFNYKKTVRLLEKNSNVRRAV